jgi:hypothetical protein
VPNRRVGQRTAIRDSARPAVIRPARSLWQRSQRPPILPAPLNVVSSVTWRSACVVLPVSDDLRGLDLRKILQDIVQVNDTLPRCYLGSR